jgi:hypothetical protein
MQRLLAKNPMLLAFIVCSALFLWMYTDRPIEKIMPPLAPEPSTSRPAVTFVDQDGRDLSAGAAHWPPFVRYGNEDVLQKSQAPYFRDRCLPCDTTPEIILQKSHPGRCTR